MDLKLTHFNLIVLLVLGVFFINTIANSKPNSKKYSGKLIAGKNKISFLSEKLKIVGHLYLPTDYNKYGNYSAIVVITPASGVKEQTAGIYAKKLSEKGYVALAFDHRTYGESEGKPRAMENGPMKVEDIKNAISFISTVPGVSKEKVAELGICSGAGYGIQTACFDARVKSLAIVSGFIDFIDYGLSGGTQYMYQLSGDKISQFQQQIKIASDARQEYFETGKVVQVDGIPPKGSNMGEFWERAADYYHNSERGGAIKTFDPKRAAMSLDTRYFFNPTEHIELMKGKPFLAIVGTNAHTAYFSEVAVNKAKGDKELSKINGAHHFDLYDQEIYVNQAIEKLDEFFKRTLK